MNRTGVMENDNEVEGKQMFGVLTDNDLVMVEGKCDEMLGGEASE